MEGFQEFVRPEDYGLPRVSSEQRLTPLDINLPRLYGTRWILCFTIDGSADVAEVYEQLKTGLAYTIVEIPWIAGKIGPEKGSDPEHLRIQVVDGNFGVCLKLNDLTTDENSISYKELKAAHFPLSKFTTARLFPVGYIPEGENPPVIIAQANFIQGGLLLTVCAHHSLCDATGLTTILNTWAKMTSSAHNFAPFSKVNPNINDREPLMTGIPGATLADFTEYILSPSTSTSALGAWQSSTTSELPAMTSRIFCFSSPALTSLKAAAKAYSTNDAVHALVWCAMTLARLKAKSVNSDATTKLQYAANMRSRVTPPLPKDYTGNVSVGNIAALLVADLAAPDGLIKAAAAIRKSVLALDRADRMMAMIGLLGSRGNPMDFKFCFDAFLGPDLVTSTWADCDVFRDEWVV